MVFSNHLGAAPRVVLPPTGLDSNMTDTELSIICSFDYAAYNALKGAMVEMPEQDAELERHAQDWRDRVMAAFMEGYLKAAQGCPSYPQEPTHAQALIDLFTLEKALYEVRYELDNRPTWVTVPLRGLLRLLD